MKTKKIKAWAIWHKELKTYGSEIFATKKSAQEVLTSVELKGIPRKVWMKRVSERYEVVPVLITPCVNRLESEV